MARASHKKAAKDYPEHGIKKGDMYWFAKIKTGPRSSRTIRQIDPIKPQQLTSSDFLSSIYDFNDEIAGLEDLDTARDIAERLRELGNEQTEKYDNMPEGFQQGSTGELLQERADACENAADEIEGICDEWETARDEHAVEADADEEEEKSESDDEEDEEELDVEDGSDEFDAGDFISQIQDVSLEG